MHVVVTSSQFGVQIVKLDLNCNSSIMDLPDFTISCKCFDIIGNGINVESVCAITQWLTQYYEMLEYN
jgi:hypothetical protein